MALTKITSSLVAINSLTAANIADNAVDATKIASNSILTRHIDDDQITGDQLADNLTIAGTLTSTGAFTSPGIDDNADAIAITIDSSERVGIGTTTPVHPLQVNADNDGIMINNSGQTNGEFAALYFTSHNVAAPYPKMAIASKRTGDYGVGDMYFAVDSNADEADVNIDTDVKMVIKNDGKVGIGTASPLTPLHIAGNANNAFLINPLYGTFGNNIFYNGSAWDSFNHSSTGGVFQISDDGSFAFRRATAADPPVLSYSLYIGTTGKVGIGTTSPAKNLDVSGEIRATTGILFGSDTAAANTLDDYEEGTWTPTYTVDGGGSAGTVTSTNVATYTKIGNLVHCRVRSYYVPTSGTVPTAYNISLPFQAKNNGGLAGYGVGREIAQNGKSLFIEIDGNQTAGKIKCKDGSAPPANAYIDIAFTYEAA